MNRDELIQFLKSEPMTFTYAEIEQMMDEELAKDPSEMDTDFIDLCAEVLCKALDEHKEKELNKKANNKRIKINVAKIVALIAIIAFVLGFAVPASAKYIYNDTSDKIVKFYEDHFSINLRNNNTDEAENSNDSIDLVTKLKENGFDKVILPSVLLTDDYTYDVDLVDEENLLSAFINFENNNTIAYITITKYKNSVNNLLDNDMQMTSNYNSAKQLSINGNDIFIFGNDENSSIVYISDNTDYNINLSNCDFDSAIKIAESIK